MGTDGQSLIEAIDDCWAAEIKEQEQAEENEEHQNKIKHLKESFLNVLKEEACKNNQDLVKLKEEICRLNFEKEVLLNEQKSTNDKHEEDMKNLEMEFKNESEKVRQLDIQNKMMMAENQWLKNSLKQSHDEYYSQLSFEKEVLLNEQKLTNDKHEEDMKKLEMELKNESERVRQLGIQTKMIMAENQWLINSLEQTHDEYLKDREKMVKDLAKEKMRTSFKLW